jgi:hypothetical protein
VLRLTEEEIDFIINYDIKYRMSADDGSDVMMRQLSAEAKG